MPTKSDFFQNLEIVRNALKTTSAREALTTIGNLLQDDAIKREFFNMLSTPDWIEPLAAKGFFTDPPAAEVVEGRGIRYVNWPQGRYLVRMSNLAPNSVARILASVDSDNASVIGNILDAALSMPMKIAATLVPTMRKAIERGSLWLSFDDASELCARLATEGQSEAALKLADSMFKPKQLDNNHSRATHDEHWQKEGLKKVVPALAVAIPKDFVQTLCEWLRATIASEEPHTGFHHSYVWRPAIEEHEQNSDYNVAGTMVGFLREAIETAIERGVMTLKEALELLDSERYTVFKRIRIHLINIFAEQEPDIAHATIMDQSLIDQHEFKHEYAMLLGRRFLLLNSQERDTWLSWIDAGPDMSDYDKWFKASFGKDATQADRQSRIHFWQFDRLHWVRQHLVNSRKIFYDDMLTQYGDPELSDLSVRSGSVRWGHESPVAIEELKTLDFADAVERVAAWKPAESTFRAPDREGLASVFGQYVAENSESFSKEAKRLTERHPIFVRRFIETMSDAVKTGKEVDVVCVLRLCQWVTEQPVDQKMPKAEHERLVDENWQWARDSISRFIEAVCRAKAGEAPRYLLDGIREMIGDLLARLTRDTNQSNLLEDLEEQDPRIYDYRTVAINSPRGRAVEAMFDYARWIGNHKKQNKGGQETVPGGFENMPEVKMMLEWQIAPENASVHASASIGTNMSLLYWLDKKWLQEWTDRIFDLRQVEQKPKQPFGWAAWNAFIVWVQPHIEFYKLLKNQFAYAVEQSAKVTLEKDSSREQPMLHLGEHLMVLYGRGQLGLDDDKGLIRRFLKQAVQRIRTQTVRFIGSSLRGDEKVATEVLKRFMDLWEWYWADTGRKDVADCPQSDLFGGWFVCEQFPDNWCLEQLEQFVQVVPMAEPDDLIVDRLVNIAEVDISRATNIIDQMARGDADGWRVSGWERKAIRILELAMQQPGEVREKAVCLIDFLGRKGYIKFGELLTSK